MITLLEKAGYSFKDNLKVWSLPCYESINYSDGDEIEQRIEAIVAQSKDVSLHSQELLQNCNDWPSLYHLSKIRTNILRPFSHLLQGTDILEVGAGCGAITRYLGECGANVLALEGSLKRASITRCRTRDLENVTLLAENFSQLPCLHQFDIITLIGVLEYANLFMEGENRPLAMLQHVRSLLKPNGKLIIAIENQLGLKYFAGAPEDHIGEKMFGIEGCYKKNQPETFGRAILKNMLDDAGLTHQEWLTPFPDYKFPISIITQQGMMNKDFDASALAWQSVKNDPQLSFDTNFSLELVWPQIIKNHLGLELSNSFLIIASPHEGNVIDESILAYHYNTGRAQPYCKATIFKCVTDKDIFIEYKQDEISKIKSEQKNSLIKFILPEKTKYTLGEPLSFELIKILNKKERSFSEIANFIKKYLFILLKLLESEKIQIDKFSPYIKIPGSFFDAIPQNIIINKQGAAVFIDREWTLNEPLEIGYLLFRALYAISGNIKEFTVLLERQKFIYLSLEAVEPGLLNHSDYERYFSMEQRIQNIVSTCTNKPFLVWMEHIGNKTIDIDKDKLLSQQEVVIRKKNILLALKEYFLIKLKNRKLNTLIAQLKESPLRNGIINDFKILLYSNFSKKKLTLETIIKPSIFDEDWYINCYPDILESEIAPFTHYMTYGWKEFRNPHWLFDTKFFLEKYPEVTKQKLDPFTYYCIEGWKKQMQPHPTFDVHWYTEKNPGALDQNPLIHYTTKGWKDGSSPNPLFFSSWYLRKYPDLPKGYNPFFHYLNFGKAEGRLPNIFNTPLCKIERKGFDPSAELLSEAQQYRKEKVDPFLQSLNEDKETILLVSHEASRTGAPVLVYNLASSLKEKYNVIILTLEGGCLLADFQTVCSLLLGPLTPQQKNTNFLYDFFKEINKKIKIKYAIINSIVSSITLLPLFENNIVIIHLIHEFSSYTRPSGLFLNSAFFSAKQIYSADLVRENAIKDTPQLNFISSITLPQGICSVPALGDYSEEIKIKDVLKAKGWTEDTILVLGIGTVSLRKGVDLFISCAKRVLELGPKKRFRFIWIGEGFDPELDGIYSVYLADQIERSNLKDIVSIIEPIKNIDAAYLLSDIIFLSSRLDPLPLVALDALNHQKPLICFESATGIAEYLLKDPNAAFGVVPYLNIEVAAQKIYQLIEDNTLCSKVGAAGKKITSLTFNFQKYAEQIDQIALQSVKDKKQELQDEKILKKSNLFKMDFMVAPHAQLPCFDVVKWYIKNQKLCFQLRKPFPGFHSELYAEYHDLEGKNALAHYISNGFPSGPWESKIINKKKSKSPASVSLATALHIHLYYPEMASEILHRLRGINYKIDLLISVTSHEDAAKATKVFSKYKNGTILIKEFPNRGRNFGPLFTGFREIILEKYKIIGHIHTKKSVDIGETGIMDSILWTHFLYSNLLGGFYNMANTILEEFQNNPELGLVFPDDPNIVTWGKNKPFAEELIRKMKINFSLVREHLNFPIGSMFWARTEALYPLFNLNFSWDDYPEEPLPYDGSMLHAIERLLPLVVEYSHYQSASTYLEGVVR